MSVSQIGHGEAVVDQILAEVADAEGCRELDLPPLYGFVDTDALCKLIEHDTDLTLSFLYNGYEVTVETPDEIDVTADGDASETAPHGQ